MSAPTAPLAARLYEYLGYARGLAWVDAENGFAVSKLCTAQMASWETIGRVADVPSLWSDPVNAPDEIIENMAMRRGLRGAFGETIPRLRDRLANPPSAEVGSTPAIAEAVRGILGVPGAYITVNPNYHPIDGTTDGHTTVTVDPDDAAGITLAQMQTAAEDAAPDWIVIHAVIAEGDTVDELTDDIDDIDAPINEL